jgi:hypothetical protein
MNRVLPSVTVDLEAIVAVIANSPIIDRGRSLNALLGDWQNTRVSEQVDDVVLAWLASHSRGRASRVLS